MPALDVARSGRQDWRKTSFSRRNPATCGQARSTTNGPPVPLRPKPKGGEGEPAGPGRFPAESDELPPHPDPGRTEAPHGARSSRIRLLFTMSQQPAVARARSPTLQTKLPSWMTRPPARHQTNGGARRDRTDDLMLAKHALSQLSYGPCQRSGAKPESLRTGRAPAPAAPNASRWWARVDSNYRPHPYQGCALTN
jgi:hypothetical protein